MLCERCLCTCAMPCIIQLWQFPRIQSAFRWASWVRLTGSALAHACVYICRISVLLYLQSKRLSLSAAHIAGGLPATKSSTSLVDAYQSNTYETPSNCTTTLKTTLMCKCWLGLSSVLLKVWIWAQNTRWYPANPTFSTWLNQLMCHVTGLWRQEKWYINWTYKYLQSAVLISTCNVYIRGDIWLQCMRKEVVIFKGRKAGWAFPVQAVGCCRQTALVHYRPKRQEGLCLPAISRGAFWGNIQALICTLYDRSLI